MDSGSLEQAMHVARDAAQRGGTAALAHYRGRLHVRLKDDRTPVTEADADSEAAILEVLRRRRPEDDILSEESGLHGGGAELRWIVDPLDGTRGFIRGGVHWGPLVALLRGAEVLAGAMALPALGRTYWAARGHGAWRDDERLRVSEVEAWPEATFALGEPRFLLAPPYAAGVGELARTAASTRCPGDLAGCAMLLDGRAEAWVEAGVKLWDLAPLVVLVEEAGGTFTDLAGGRDWESGGAVASNGRLHGHVVGALAAPAG